MSDANADLSAEAQWRQLVEKALGATSQASLNSRLDTGAEIAPLYTPRDAGDKALASGHPGTAPFVRGVPAQALGARP
jgi:hypothetical protein